MSRYIDIEPIEKEIERELTIGEIKILSEHEKGVLDVYNAIKKVPTSDVEEVVRCKDCVFFETAYYDNGTKQVCRLYQRQMQEDDFCAYGTKNGRM